MPYAQLDESHVEVVTYYENLRGSFKFLNGQTVGNIECLTNEELSNHVIYPVVDNKPEFDARYQYLIQGNAAIVNNQVIRQWDVVEYDIGALKDKRIAEVNKHRDLIIDGGVEFNGSIFDSDAVARANINATASSIGLGEVLPEGFSWRNANNIDVPMDADLFKAFAMAVFSHVYAAHMTARNHKDTINAMDTAEAVAAYSID